MQPSIVQAQPIILDGGTTPGCLPAALGVARERVIYTAPEGSVAAVVSRYTLSLLHEYGGTDGHSRVFGTLSGSCEMVEPV